MSIFNLQFELSSRFYYLVHYFLLPRRRIMTCSKRIGEFLSLSLASQKNALSQWAIKFIFEWDNGEIRQAELSSLMSMRLRPGVFDSIPCYATKQSYCRCSNINSPKAFIKHSFKAIKMHSTFFKTGCFVSHPMLSVTCSSRTRNCDWINCKRCSAI